MPIIPFMFTQRFTTVRDSLQRASWSVVHGSVEAAAAVSMVVTMVMAATVAVAVVVVIIVVVNVAICTVKLCPVISFSLACVVLTAVVPKSRTKSSMGFVCRCRVKGERGG